jgi:inosose dehydratase
MRIRSRRETLQTLATLAAGGALGPLRLVRAMAPDGKSPDGICFGVQLNAFPIDPGNFATFLDALRQIKQIGYQGFESSFRNLEQQFAAPKTGRHAIEQTGLTFFGIHVFLPTGAYDPATGIAASSVYQPVARGGAALGAKHIVLSGAPVKNTEQLKRKIEALNAAGRFARSVGLTAAYHNHWQEFESKVGDHGEMEALYTQTDRTLVSLVLDAGHAYRGGVNLPAFIKAHAGRILAFHLRDYNNGRLVSLGQGTFPLAQVAATIKSIAWKGWVENEEEREDLSKSGIEVIAPAYKAMKKAFAG